MEKGKLFEFAGQCGFSGEVLEGGKFVHIFECDHGSALHAAAVAALVADPTVVFCDCPECRPFVTDGALLIHGSNGLLTVLQPLADGLFHTAMWPANPLLAAVTC